MKKTASILILTMLAGCAGTGSQFVPIVDRPGATYHNDLRECQAHAEKVMSAAQGAAAGAIGGALVGALLGMALGGRDFAGEGARAGMVGGALGGAQRGETDQRTIISKCLASRGHSVLN